MKPYPKYKSSGVPWLGDVPEHWEVKRVKHVAQHTTGWTPPTGERAGYEGTNLWATIADIGARVITDTKSKISDEAVTQASIVVSPVGSLLFSFKLSVGQVSVAGVPLYTNEAIATFLPSDGYTLSWAFYAFPAFIPENSAINIYGAKLLNQQRINDAALVVPAPDEQSAIATYLDTETARIDTLVAEKEKLNGLLSEARMSTITRLIVGADLPGVPSGNPWVPHLPQGWQLKRLKHLADVRSGLAKGKDYGDKPTVEMPYLRVANVQDGHLNLTEVLMIEVAADEAERFLLQSGDVLMNEGGDYDKLGRGAVWSGEVTPCLHQNHVFAVRPYEEEVSEWLAAITQTRNAKFYFKSNAKQSTNLASINQTNVKELPVLLPPPKERQQILSQLRTEVLKIDGLIAHVEKEIELLKELRSATITDAVLGRIDLRDHTKKNKQDMASELQPAL